VPVLAGPWNLAASSLGLDIASLKAENQFGYLYCAAFGCFFETHTPPHTIETGLETAGLKFASGRTFSSRRDYRRTYFTPCLSKLYIVRHSGIFSTLSSK
jgi:hypothetical protein